MGTDELKAQRNRGKCLLRRLLRVSYGRFDPFVLTFNLETEAVSFSTMRRSIDIRI